MGTPPFLRQHMLLHERCYHSAFAASQLPGSLSITLVPNAA